MANARKKKKKKILKGQRSAANKNHVSGSQIVTAITGIAANVDSMYWEDLAEHAEAMIDHVEDKDGLSLRQMFNSLHNWKEYSVGVTKLKEKLGKVKGEQNASHVEVLQKAIIAYGADHLKRI